MEDFNKKTGCVRANRVVNKNLTFDFSKMNINAYFVLAFILILLIAFLSKAYTLISIDIGILGYFITFKILYKKINFKDGLIYFENDSIIQTTFSGKRVIDCTKGITIRIKGEKHIPISYDESIIEHNINSLFHELDVTYKLIIDYYDEYGEQQSIVIARTSNDSGKEEMEKFMENFYYEKDESVEPKEEIQDKIRFCM